MIQDFDAYVKKLSKLNMHYNKRLEDDNEWNTS